jgi:glycine betaine/choline ABC-type transport system substrate-binding protein
MARIQTLCLIVAAAAAACRTGPRGIVVGSKNFTEQIVLGEIVAGQIERKLSVEVDRKLNLGGTLLAHQALVSGSIDVYPEYTGTALTAILHEKPMRDADQVFEKVAAEYAERFQLRWLPPLGFNNTFAMVVREHTARAYGLRTLSDAARRVEPWRLGAGYEFLQRPDGLDGLIKAYGLRVDGRPISMDLGLLYRALEGRQVDMVAANGTDGQIGVLNVVVLADDKHYFPPYECALAVRDAALAAHPPLRSALMALSGKISDEVMRRLNYEVEGKHRSPREVAAEFLDGLAAAAR